MWLFNKNEIIQISGDDMQSALLRVKAGVYEESPASRVVLACRDVGIYRLNFLPMYTTTPMIFALSPTAIKGALASLVANNP